VTTYGRAEMLRQSQLSPQTTRNKAVKTVLRGFKEGDKLLLPDAKNQRPEAQLQERNVGYEADICYRK
jgi:hypothetical protein